MRVGVYANLRRRGSHEALSRLFSLLTEHGMTAVVGPDLASHAPDDCLKVSSEDVPDSADFVMALGGDGTILSTARAVGDREIPILGVNVGSVGFLTGTTMDELPESVARIAAGDYAVVPRMSLSAFVGSSGRELWALNETVIERSSHRVLGFDVFAGDDRVAGFYADGLIVASPTGSSAYALAAGGPIVAPTVSLIIVVPIAPITLGLRPFLAGPDEEIRVEVIARDSSARLTADGQESEDLLTRDRVVVRRSRHTVKLVDPWGRSFYDTMREKLHWGARPGGLEDERP
jgi:NAD+ kinase